MKYLRVAATGFLALILGAFAFAPAPTLYAAEKKVVEQEKEQGFIASKDGDKFHRTTCRMAKKIKPENKVAYGSKIEAEKDGKTPCGICKP